MQHFYEKPGDGETTYWFENDHLNVELNEANFYGNLHVQMDDGWSSTDSPDCLYDRATVLDPDDNLWYQFWRYDVGDEKFRQLEFMMRKVGSYLCRRTVLVDIRDLFEKMHPITDNDLTHLLEPPDAA